MKEIHVTPIKKFPISGRVLSTTDAGGDLTGGVHKDGRPLERRFSAGAVALQEKDGVCAVAPLDFHAAVEFAERVIEGDVRAVTEPGSILMLSAALIAIVQTWPVPSAPAAANAAEVV